jgi:hypothetical protein
MTRPPIFDSTADAAEFLVQHGEIGHYLTIEQYRRFLEFLFLWADGGTSLPVIMMEFYRGEIERFDEIVNGGDTL